MPGETVPLKEHFEALHLADQRAVELVREWVKERLESHNGILAEWRHTSEMDRSNFARKDALDALQKEFVIYKEITAKALTLAEGKSKGFDAVRTGMSFAAGLIIASVTVYAATKGLR
jgi:hypothetical protein